jgi:hypothetical protein
MATASIPFSTPIGDLEWVFITGEGKENLNGDMKYQATVVVSPEQAKEFEAKLNKFWADNRPKSVLKPKSTGIKPHKMATDKVDPETGKKVYQETGKFVITASTGTHYQDGKPKTIETANAKGAKVDLLGKSIGNGSRGLLKGIMKVYEVKSKSGGITDAGVSLYLNSIQLTKFIERTSGDTFEEVKDEQGDSFEGVNPDFAGVTDTQEQIKPRL